MIRIPPAMEPSSYLRYYGPVLGTASIQAGDTALRFLRLGPREGPIKSHRVFSNVTPGNQAAAITFADFEMDYAHIAQIFMGVSPGGRVRVFTPLDQRVLKWDKQNLDITERDTANLEYEESPIDAPTFSFWVAPTKNFVPAFDAENVLNDVRPSRTININLGFIGFKYTYQFVEKGVEPDLWDKLNRFQIPSTFITFGGKI